MTTSPATVLKEETLIMVFSIVTGSRDAERPNSACKGLQTSEPSEAGAEIR